MSGKIQIVLPGLFDLPLAELARDFVNQELPNLNRLLRLATPQANDAFSIDAILHNALAQALANPASASALPLAQAFASPDDQPGRHLLFEAIHLYPDMQSAVIVPIQKNQKNLKDINIIINDLGDLFKVDCDISVIDDGRYLMRLEDFEAPTHYPHVLSVLGKTANPYIEQSRANLPWYKLLNEMQMFMHQHEVNHQRLQQGLNPINSLWFWGAGRRPEMANTNLAWLCEDQVLNRFAQSIGLSPNTSLDKGSANLSGDAIVIDLRLIETLKSGSMVALDQLLLDIDRRLFEPMLNAFDVGHKHLLLRSGFQVDFNLKPRAGWKFWRCKKTLFDWYQGNHEA